MKIHRYKVRPGIEDIPTQLPQGQLVYLDSDETISLSVELEDRRKDISMTDEDFDLDYFIVLDEEFGQPYLPFYNWAEGKTATVNPTQAAIISNYNDIMDDINWLVRDKSKEIDIIVKEDKPQLTLYEMNQQAYNTIAPKNKEELMQSVETIVQFMIRYADSKYSMLLCRELNDYTIFKKSTVIAYQRSATKIIDLLLSRGPILDFHVNKDNEYLECWVRHKEDHTPHMYVLFNCEDFVVEY